MERATVGTENLAEKMPHFGLGITEEAEGGKDPASEECTAKFGGPLGPLKTRESTVQNTNFIINIKKLQCIYAPASAWGPTGKKPTLHVYSKYFSSLSGC